MAGRLGWGVIGTGRRAREVMFPALMASPLSRLSGVCGKDPKRAREAVQTWPDLKVFPDLGDMLKDPEIEVIYISSPHFLHVPQAVQAIEAGKHVFMESPMALSVDGAHKLVEKARSRSVKLGVAFQYRYHSALGMLKQRLKDPDLGQVIHVETRCADPLDWPAGWWTDAQRAGPAALLRFGVHALDLACWLMPQPVAEVMAMARDDEEKQVQTMISVLLRFQEDAMGFSLGTSCFGRQDHSVKVCAGKAHFQVQGDFTGQGPVTFRETSGEGEKVVEFEPENPIGSMLDAFAGAVKTGADFGPQGREGKSMVEVICAVIESVKSKRAVKAGEIQRLT